MTNSNPNHTPQTDNENKNTTENKNTSPEKEPVAKTPLSENKDQGIHTIKK